MYIFSHNLDLRKNASFVGARKLFVREQNKTSAKIRRVRNLMGLRYLIFFLNNVHCSVTTVIVQEPATEPFRHF